MTATRNILIPIFLAFLWGCKQITPQDESFPVTQNVEETKIDNSRLGESGELQENSNTTLGLVKALNQTIAATDDSWTIEIDTINKYNHPALRSGTPVGTLRIKKTVSAVSIGQIDIAEGKDEIVYFIYKPANHRLEDEIINYHMYASCLFSTDNLVNEILYFRDCMLFLPMYPCWSGGYSESAKELILKLALKLGKS